MAMQDYRRQMDKIDALGAAQFERAVALRDAQYRDRERFVTAVARMLEEADPSGRESAQPVRQWTRPAARDGSGDS
jgi:hypothetical protein